MQAMGLDDCCITCETFALLFYHITNIKYTYIYLYLYPFLILFSHDHRRCNGRAQGKKPSITQSQASVAVNVALSENRGATCKPMIECQAHVA